jgi:hypothetical protein
MADDDVETLEDLLRTLDLSSGLAIMISSPGGSGLAAERMINVLRSYSGTGEYWAIVPAKAKSAATMVCLGASRILMGPASELGPIDPQVVFKGKVVSVHDVIDSYHRLFRNAVRASGNLEPYLQQLASFDASEINHLEAERDLATDMAVRCLQTGMLSGASARSIKEKVKIFLLPQHKKAHGRPIYHAEAASCGLQIDLHEPDSDQWRMVYELHVRTRDFVSLRALKILETAEQSFVSTAPSADVGSTE